jgi:hypothetical protein
MKPFLHYLTESQHTYEFKIKIADIEPTPEMLDHLEHALKAYDLESISKPKRLPIQDHIDFPQMGPIEVYVMDVVLKYPCNDAQLRQTVHDQGRFPLANIMVVPKNHPEELRRDEEAAASDKKPEAILTKDLEDTGVKGEDFHGKKQIDSMLKELTTRKYEFAEKEPTKVKTTNDLPVGEKSPIGSKQNKITTPAMRKK